MEKDKNLSNTLSKWLNVIVAIAGEKELPASKIADILGTSTRNAYYLLEALSNYGFIVHHLHGQYNLDPKSPFFKEIVQSVNFTDEQAGYLYNLLKKESVDNAFANKLMLKIQKFYHLNEQTERHSKYGSYKNTVLLQRAIRNKRLVILHDYASSNSQTISDRLVEPFMFLADDTDVRAYEIKSGINKTFKISRISYVEILDTEWFNESKHKKVFTDIFLYSGETRHHIKLRLNITSHNFMIEENPLSEKFMAKDGKKHWILDTEVVNYLGIGRFILGLFDDIDIIEDEGLKKYVFDKANSILKKNINKKV